MIGVVVPYWAGHEPLLHQTLDNIRDTAPAPHPHFRLYPMQDFDGTLGAGLLAHRGFEFAKHDGCSHVLLTDAHVLFAPGAIQDLVRTAGENALSCCRCHHNPGLKFGVNVKHGGSLRKMIRLPGLGCHNAGLAVTWAEPGEPMTAVLGACYCLSLDLYARMGKPLELLRRWGSVEEMLTLGAWFAGADLKLADADMAHKQKSKDSFSLETRHHIWANKLVVIDSCPMPEAERQKLVDFTLSSSHCRAYRKEVLTLWSQRLEDTEKLRRHWQAESLRCGRSWVGLRERLL